MWVRWGLDRDWRRVAILIVGSYVLTLGLYAWHPLSPPLEVYGARQADLPAKAGREFRYVTARQARLSLSDEDLFLDVRDPADYQRLHATGAVSAPYRELEARAAEVTRAGPFWRVIIYSYDVDSPLAVQTVAKLYGRPGLEDFRVIRGGFEEWQAAGLPVKKGPGWRQP